MTIPKIIDETGNRYGRLVVLGIGEKPLGATEKYWECLCDCGNKKNIRGSSLRRGHTKSCGCLVRERMTEIGKKSAKNEIGNKYGKLTILRRAKEEEIKATNRTRIFWFCICDCGNTVVVASDSLRSGNTTSCGCIKSRMEIWFKEALKQYPDITVVQEYVHPDLKYKRHLRFDFYLNIDGTAILIELDGPQHSDETNPYFSKDGRLRDTLKNNFCFEMDALLYRIPYTQQNIFPSLVSLLYNGEWEELSRYEQI